MTMKIKFWYFANPYTHTDKKVVEERVQEQRRLAAHLIKQGYYLLQPIEMCHTMALEYDLPTGYEYWKKRDRGMIDLCFGTIVCLMDGWDKSVGVLDELEYTKQLGKPIKYLDTKTLELRDAP